MRNRVLAAAASLPFGSSALIATEPSRENSIGCRRNSLDAEIGSPSNFLPTVTSSYRRRLGTPKQASEKAAAPLGLIVVPVPGGSRLSNGWPRHPW